MITKMKKLLLFMSHPTNDMDTDLTVLGQLGLMHINPFQPAKDDSIDRVKVRIKQLEKAIFVLDQYSDETIKSSAETEDYAKKERGEIVLLDKVLDTYRIHQDLEKQLSELNKAQLWYSNWGEISLADIQAINSKGVSLKLYEVSDQDLKSVQKQGNVKVIGRLKDMNQMVLISEDADESLNFQQVDFPDISQSEVEAALAEKKAMLYDNTQLLYQLSLQKNLLQEALAERNRRLDIRNVQYGGVAYHDCVRCWEGFIPEDKVANVVEAAEKNGWGYVIKEPRTDEYDKVPTLLRNPKWSHKIKPVMSFMGLVPGYDEIDVSKVFLIFFTFFTGILVGDAGYGLIFFGLTLLVHWKQSFAKKIEFGLMYTLSVSIMTWGVLTGTYFGSEVIANIPSLSNLKVQQLASF